MALYTQQHYVDTASFIKGLALTGLFTTEQIQAITDAWVKRFSLDNSKFKALLFYKASGVTPPPNSDE